jgi:hypothetical protein
LLLLWNAHVCVLWVTETMWSAYLLKYTLKAEAVGNLQLTAGICSDLGLTEITEQEAMVLSGVVLTQVWSVTEATWHLAGIDLLGMPPVLYVNTAPPNKRSS